MEKKYADIIVNIAHENVDRPFEYKIPAALEGLLDVGMSVQVPFGKGDRLITGVVIRLSDRATYPPEKIKDIAALSEGGVALGADHIKLAAWMKQHYGGTMIAALKTVLPTKKAFKPKEKKSIKRLWSTAATQEALTESVKKKQMAKARLLAELCHEAELPYDLVRTKLHIQPSTLNSLEKQGIITVERVAYYRNPVSNMDRAEVVPQLTAKQKEIVDNITADYQAGERGTYLIHGITGSGKTEVYLNLIEQVLSTDFQCIVLIPEIALTYQMLLRFYKRFGDRVSVINSALSAGEKYDQCERARRGEIDIIIGPRSALFVPFNKLGMIIIDEEHEPSYKSENTPRYHVRETAAALARIKGASLVLGSATPSLEAYYRAKAGKYRLFELESRQSGAILPTVHIVDMREELKSGNRSMFSRHLQEMITERLNRGEQTMLFINRRGYSAFISCRACGHVLMCPHCDVSLAKHKARGGDRMICHYCAYETTEKTRCPACASPYFSGMKAGTQQVVELTKQLWPAARVLRMDGDTTKKKDGHGEILAAFESGKADILVGTQMIVKGHDFPNVTLVGIMAADLSLNVNDFRAGERTFQLLTQAVGRSGRGEKRGEALIQSYKPEHYSIQCAARQDYKAFYDEEIIYRDIAAYPPASHMLALLLNAADEARGMALGRELVAALMTSHPLTESVNAPGFPGAPAAPVAAGTPAPLRIIGPAPAIPAKINDIYRFVIYIKHGDYQKLIAAKDSLELLLEEKQARGEMKGVSLQFDFNPLS